MRIPCPTVGAISILCLLISPCGAGEVWRPFVQESDLEEKWAKESEKGETIVRTERKSQRKGQRWKNRT